VESDILAGLNAAATCQSAALARVRGCRAVVTRPARPTPFAFALIVELFRERLTTEALETRAARMIAELEAAAVEDVARDRATMR
jgi:ATP-dependent Lhr-like helicase